MFTGLIEGKGKIIGVTASSNEGGVMRIESLPWKEPLTIGESIAVNGACLTVVSHSEDSFEADLSPETLSRTNLKWMGKGDLVNLERALRLGDRLGGHLVLGHVDGLGTIREIQWEGRFYRVAVAIPEELCRYTVEKGSIAVDGISLTIAALHENVFSVAVIPKTWDATNLSARQPGERVNIETDIIARHIEQLLSPYGKGSGITESFLGEHGFL